MTRLVAGLGMRRGCSMAELIELLKQACFAVGRPVDSLAAPAFKRREAGLRAAARRLGLELVFVDDPALREVQASCVTRSAVVEDMLGFSGSVAEASALAAAGPRARLVLPRIVGRSSTCAVAESV